MMRNGNGGLKGIQRIRFPASTTAVSSRRNVRFPARSVLDINEYYAVLGLTPFASKSDVKFAYKRLALKYHPDVIRGENGGGKNELFREIKSAYESLMQKFEEEEELAAAQDLDMYDEWDEWMGFEGGIPTPCHSF